MLKKIVLFSAIALMSAGNNSFAADKVKLNEFSEDSGIFSLKQLPKTIYTYEDDGVDPECLAHCESCLRYFYGGKTTQIKRINAAALQKTDWMRDAGVLIIGGGADIPYHEQLHGTGCENIRNFVKNGGIYIGFCAGAYFGADRIEFAKESQNEICGERTLKFFPGIAKGPVFGPFKQGSRSGARAAEVFIDNGRKSFFTYYNGGSTFLMSDRKSAKGVEVLGRYGKHEDADPAVIKCPLGEGYAILSGVHLEFSPEKMQEDEKKRRKAEQSAADGYDDYGGEALFEYEETDAMDKIIEGIASTDTARLLFLKKIFADIFHLSKE